MSFCYMLVLLAIVGFKRSSKYQDEADRYSMLLTGIKIKPSDHKWNIMLHREVSICFAVALSHATDPFYHSCPQGPAESTKKCSF